MVGAGLFGCCDSLALGEHDNADRFTRPVRQRCNATDELVGVSGVRLGPNMQLDRFVELCAGNRLRQRNRLPQRVLLIGLDGLRRLAVAAFRVCPSPSPFSVL